MPTTDLARTPAEQRTAPPSPVAAPGVGNAATAAALDLGTCEPEDDAMPAALGLLGDAAVWVLDALPFPVAFDLALTHHEADWARAWLARVDIAAAAQRAGNAWGRFLDLHLPDGASVEVGGNAEVSAGGAVKGTRVLRVARRGATWCVTRARAGAVATGVGEAITLKGANGEVISGGGVEGNAGVGGEEVATWNVTGAEAFGAAAGSVERWSGAGQLLVLARVLDCCEARAPDACTWRAGPSADAAEVADLLGLAHADVSARGGGSVAVGWEGGDTFVEAELGAEGRLSAFSGIWDLLRRRAAAPVVVGLAGLGLRVRVRVWGDVADALERDDPGDLQFDAEATSTDDGRVGGESMEAVRAPALVSWLRSLLLNPTPEPVAGGVVHARDLPDRTLVRSARRSLDPEVVAGRVPALMEGLAGVLPAHGLTAGSVAAELVLELAVGRDAVVAALGGEDAAAGVGEPEEVLLMLARALGGALTGSPCPAPAPLDLARGLEGVEVRSAAVVASARVAAGLGFSVSPALEVGGATDGWATVERAWSVEDQPVAELLRLVRGEG